MDSGGKTVGINDENYNQKFLFSSMQKLTVNTLVNAVYTVHRMVIGHGQIVDSRSKTSFLIRREEVLLILLKLKMEVHNPGMDLDLAWLEMVRVNLPAVKRRAETLGTKRTVKMQWQAAWLCKALTCIDLTTLSGDDTEANVQRLCLKAARPLRQDIVEAIGMEDHGLKTGAVCVYPSRVKEAVKWLKKFNAPDVPVAAVATGFPSGQYSLATRLEEIKFAINEGAKEIDIVINRTLALQHRWQELYDEVKAMKAACGAEIHMKSILAIGELGNMANVYKASLVCMMAGSDFIKTSTGKESVNAILPVGLVMCRFVPRPLIFIAFSHTVRNLHFFVRKFNFDFPRKLLIFLG